MFGRAKVNKALAFQENSAARVEAAKAAYMQAVDTGTPQEQYEAACQLALSTDWAAMRLTQLAQTAKANGRPGASESQVTQLLNEYLQMRAAATSAAGSLALGSGLSPAAVIDMTFNLMDTFSFHAGLPPGFSAADRRLPRAARIQMYAATVPPPEAYREDGSTA